MKVLVQNPFTLSYFQDMERWTAKPEQALVFQNTQSAIQFCREHDLSDMQVVLKFPDDKFDVEVPVGSVPTTSHLSHRYETAAQLAVR